jgi:tRNA (guanine-N7-)-methyltransferase
MKPEDLNYPFEDKEKSVTIIDRVWYVPENIEDRHFLFPGWNHPTLFGNDNPVKIEYCSGNGTWIAEKAERDPHSNWIGIEMRFSRVRKIWSKIANKQLLNLMALCGEGYQSTKKQFPDQSVSEIYINFPDPWPKRRHERHRIFQFPFIQELWRILKPDGIVMVVTDDAVYSSQIIDKFHKTVIEPTKEKAFQSAYPSPHYITELQDYGTSFFDDLWRSKGKNIHYHLFKKGF